MVGTQKQRLLERVARADVSDDAREPLVQGLPADVARALLGLLRHARTVGLHGMPDYGYCQGLLHKALGSYRAKQHASPHHGARGEHGQGADAGDAGPQLTAADAFRLKSARDLAD
jgi:hypothetical protein